MFPLFIDFIYFLLIIIILAFSGNIILRSLKINFKSSLENSLFSLAFSLTILSVLSHTALILQSQFLIPLIFWIFISLGFLNCIYFALEYLATYREDESGKQTYPKGYPAACCQVVYLFFLVLILTAIMSSITVKSGWQVGEGLEFFGINAHDGIWHQSLIGELKNHFPPQHPVFSGTALKGYHYLLDLLLAKFSFVFGFSELDLYFRFFPILIATLWSLATFLFAQKYFQNRTTAYFTVLFSVLGGSFAYFLPLFHASGINFDSDFGVSAPISSLINLQFAFSIPILVLTLYAFSEFLEEKRFCWGFLVVLFTGSLFGFKIYAGIIALFSISLSSLLYILKNKKLEHIWVPILSGVLGVLVYLPTMDKDAGLVFAPGEMIQSIIRGPLSWTLWELQRQVYAEHHNWLGVTRLKILAFLVFLFGNLGSKALGLVEFLRLSKTHILTKNLGLLFFSLLLPFSIPILFIQSITPFNIVQFWWYFLYFMSFPTAALLWSLVKNKDKIFQISVLSLVFILTIPAPSYVIYGYLFPKTSYIIPQRQLKALKFLKETTSPDDVILEIPIIHQNGFNFGLPFIPAIAQRRVFLGQEMVEFPYLDKKRREEDLKRIIGPLKCKTSVTLDLCWEEINLSNKTMAKNHINYVISPLSLFWLEENSKISSLIYNNDGIFIYKIK